MQHLQLDGSKEPPRRLRLRHTGPPGRGGGSADKHKSVIFHEAKGIESRRGSDPAKGWDGWRTLSQ